MKVSHFRLSRLMWNQVQYPLVNISSLTFYSTTTTTTIKSEEDSSLYRRISASGSPSKSIVPVLDKWIEEGRDVSMAQLRSIIKELRHYRHFKHALQISQWMSDKRYMILASSDVGVRLNLIGKVNGIEQAETYFNNIPKNCRTLEVYGALLSCYTSKKCVDKAEVVMQQMRELGFCLSTLNYNNLLSLYLKTGQADKADTLMHEMETKQIMFDKYTYNILLSAYGADSDIDKLEKILTKLESDSCVDADWNLYATAAIQYQRVGLVEKAIDLIQKSEKLVTFANKKNEAFSFVLTLYGTAGMKEDVLRIWRKCKLYNLSNLCYKKIMSTILKFDDIETAEEIFKEWEKSDLRKDIRIPNFYINTYCKKGLMDKAEALIEKISMNEWQKPNLYTWSTMSVGYYRSDQMEKAVEALTSALLEFYAGGRWNPDKETLIACLKHVKEKGDIVKLGELIWLLKDKGIVDLETHDKLLQYVSGEYAGEDALEGIDWDDEETFRTKADEL